MFRYIILIIVIQIWQCSAECSCGIPIPKEVIYVIGFSMAILLCTTIGLGVYVYRLKRTGGSDTVFEHERHASMIKYEQQISQNSQRNDLGNNMDEDTMQLNKNEYICNGDNQDDNHFDKAESLPREPKKVPKRVPFYPKMKEEHLYALCEAVNKHKNLKECTSLSDLDKIVNESKVDERKISKHDISASTPELDTLDEVSSTPVKVIPVFQPGLKELKLRDEMMARLKAKSSQEKSLDDDDAKESEPKTILANDQIKNHSRLDQADISSKVIQQEIMNKFIQDELKSKLNKSNINSKSESKENKMQNEEHDVVQDDIYDHPPPPRLQNDIFDFNSHNELSDFPSEKQDNELYNFPPSPKEHKLLNFSSASKQDQELYDVPPAKPKDDDFYDILPPTKIDDDLYDILPTTKPTSDVYDSVSTQNRNRVVSDGNETGYLLPLSIHDESTSGSNEVQYCNAKITNQNSL